MAPVDSAAHRRRLRALARPHRRRLGFALVLAAVATLCLPLPALYLQAVIDRVIPRGDRPLLLDLSLALLAVLVARAGAHVGLSVLLAQVGARVQTALHTSLIAHTLRLPMGVYSRWSVGELLVRFNESQGVRQLVADATVHESLDALLLACASGAMLMYHWKLGLLGIATTASYAAAWRIEAPLLRRARQKVALSAARLGAEFSDALHAIAVVRAFRAEEHIERRLVALVGELQSALYASRVVSAVRSSLTIVLAMGVTLLTTLLGARLVIGGGLSVGELAGFFGLMGFVLAPLERLTETLAATQESRVASERVCEILDQPREPDSGHLALPLHGDLAFEGVGFGHDPAGRPTLEDVSFHVAPGSVVGLTGRSGSGKTTILNLILRHLQPQRGRVLFDGVDARDWRLAHLRGSIGLVPQGCDVLDATIRENIAMGRSTFNDEDLARAAHVAGLEPVVARLSLGFDAPLGERGVRLSGGERQRVALARALLGRPRILLLDEPTSALDGLSEAAIAEALRVLARSCTVVVATHRASLMWSCDKVVVLEGGHVAECGALDELLAAGGAFERLVNEQLPAHLKPRAAKRGRRGPGRVRERAMGLAPASRGGLVGGAHGVATPGACGAPECARTHVESLREPDRGTD